jgi:hypothetical protein
MARLRFVKNPTQLPAQHANVRLAQHRVVIPGNAVSDRTMLDQAQVADFIHVRRS